jgi:hypothetical protein
MNDFDPQAPKRMNMVNQQQINNTRIESYSNTLRHRESSVVNILLFIISGFVSGMASSFHCQRFRGQEGITAKRKETKPYQRRLYSSAVLQSTRKCPRFCVRKNRPPVQSVLTKARKPSENTHSSTPSSFTHRSSRLFCHVSHDISHGPSMRRLRSSASWRRAHRPAHRPCAQAPWPRSPS